MKSENKCTHRLCFWTLIVETGASFAERFVGQSIAFVGDFDVLGPVADSPVSLQTGLAGENLHIHGIDGGGSMIVDFFAADGTNIDTLNIPLPSGNLTVGFQRAGGVTDIAGFSVFNNDPAGVAYDDIKFCSDL